MSFSLPPDAQIRNFLAQEVASRRFQDFRFAANIRFRRPLAAG